MVHYVDIAFNFNYHVGCAGNLPLKCRNSFLNFNHNYNVYNFSASKHTHNYFHNFNNGECNYERWISCR